MLNNARWKQVHTKNDQQKKNPKIVVQQNIRHGLICLFLIVNYNQVSSY